MLKNDFKIFDADSEKLIKTNIFEINFLEKNKQVNININILEFNEKLKFTRYQDDNTIIKDQYDCWVKDLFSEFSQYIIIPQCIQLAVNVFSTANISSNNRISDLRLFWSLINSEFQPCSDNCYGSESCICLNKN